MKTKYPFLAVLLLGTCFSCVSTGCVSAGYHSSSINTPEAKAQNKGIYLDFFGFGRQVYPTPVINSVPIYYQDGPVSYSGGYSGGYSGNYYGRPVSNIDYGSHYSHRDHTPVRHVPQPHYQPQPHHVPQPRVWYEPQPRTYVPPPYILPPSGGVTVVTPTYRVGPSYPPYPPRRY